jgi:hypothetical protein
VKTAGRKGRVKTARRAPHETNENTVSTAYPVFSRAGTAGGGNYYSLTALSPSASSGQITCHLSGKIIFLVSGLTLFIVFDSMYGAIMISFDSGIELLSRQPQTDGGLIPQYLAILAILPKTSIRSLNVIFDMS